MSGVQTCAFFFKAEDGIRDYKVTGVQTCAFLIQAEDGIRDYKVTGVQTCALPILEEISQRSAPRNPRPHADKSYGLNPSRSPPRRSKKTSECIPIDRKSVV